MTDFGKDTWCADSRRPGRYASGLDNVALSQYRRLITPTGQLRGGEDEALFGLDLAAECGKLVTDSDRIKLETRIQNQLKLDERALEVVVAITASRVGPAVSYEIEIDTRTDAGSFTLVLGVADVTVDLLKVILR